MKKLPDKLNDAVIVSVDERSGIYSMWLEGDFIGKPGQFANVYLPDASRLLPRPISICELEGNKLRLVFQIAGEGTRLLSTLSAGGRIRVLCGLGNGFTINQSESHVLIGGGIGIPPLIALARQIRGQYPQAQITACLGGRTAGFLEYLAGDFEKIGAEVHFATDDGSLGYHGNAVELAKHRGFFGEVYACGPRPMLKAVAEYAPEAQVSMEERMACGIGACVGCVVRIRAAGSETYKKVCKDGPVFRGREVVWDDK